MTTAPEIAASLAIGRGGKSGSERNITGILDSGAESSSIPFNVAERSGDIVHPTSGTPVTYVYGNNERLTSVGEQRLGEYIVSVMPEPASATLISVPQIVDAGHEVKFSKKYVSITDENGQYKLKYPRGKGLSWRVPINALKHLTELRTSSTSYSATLHTTPATMRGRVIDLHRRMGHAPEQIMCFAVDGPSPAWTNTGVTSDEIHKVFSKEPCLSCVMGKKKGAGTHKWTKSKRHSKTSISKGDSNPPFKGGKPMDNGNRTWSVGECLSVDNVGPINPESHEGYQHYFLFKDMCSKMIFIYLTDSTGEDSYLYALNDVVKFFMARGHKCNVVRGDYYTSYRSAKVLGYLKETNLTYESSAPYQHWENGVEREIQTLTTYVSTILHDQILLRADMWAHAAEHYVSLHNSLPIGETHKSPNEIVGGVPPIDASYRFLYAFGDLVTFRIPKKNWKFDVRNDLGFFVGEKDGIKGGCQIYRPYEHRITDRSDVYRLNVSDIQLLAWYGKRVSTREATLPYRLVSEAMIDLIPDDDDDIDYNDFAPTNTSLDPGNYWTDVDEEEDFIDIPEKVALPEANELERDEVEPTRLAFMSSLYEEIAPKLLQPEAEHPMIQQAMQSFRETAIHDNELSEEISTHDALRAPDKEEFIKAIKKEVINLIDTTETLVPISQSEADRTQHIFIGSTVKCKRKKKGNGQPDKHKARGAGRGDTLAKEYRRLGITPPPTFSPTVSALTFALVLQISIILGLIIATADITSAYLWTLYPKTAITLITRLERNVAEICGLDPKQLYRINKYIYGLPDSGRAFYHKYKAALEQEGYRCSTIDPCLFIRRENDEITFILLHVDDTFIFTSRKENLHRFVKEMSKHFPMTLDEQADSFLGMNLRHNKDGSIEMSQPKLIQKLLKEYPPRLNKRKGKNTHPYGPVDRDYNSATQILSTTYMRLLGMLMYLTRTRPDIMAATSFAGTKSHTATTADFEDLLDIVDYIRETKEMTYKLFKCSSEKDLQLTCEVDASYLTHADSKGHTGYCMGFGWGQGVFFCKSQKQSAVTTSSTHAEMRAIFALTKDILYVIQLCMDLGVHLKQPAIILEDNSAVITMATEEASYLKKCRHFIMVINYVRQQVELGLIQIQKVKGEFNNSDIMTKKVRDKSFATKARHIMGGV